MKLSRRERLGLYVLGATASAAISLVTAIQIFGGPLGAPCSDSYSCRGFLIGGAECLEDLEGRYCSRYCHVDADCAAGWRCDRAYPTVLTVHTDARGLICMRR